MDTDFPPMTFPHKEPTNIDIQKTVEEQEKLLFPPLIMDRSLPPKQSDNLTEHTVRASSQPGVNEDVDNLEQMRETAGNYYDAHLASLGLSGLTRTLFVTLVATKDSYTRATRLFPGLKLPKENFQCFYKGIYSETDIDVLNREFLRLTSPLHKETYLPPGGTGEYTARGISSVPAPQAPIMTTRTLMQIDEDLRALFIHQLLE
jgi:hypothetical protein